MKSIHYFPVVLSASLLFFTYGASNASETQIASTLECSALSKLSDKFPKYTISLTFFVADNLLQAERSWIKDPAGGPGKEVFSGSVKSDQTIDVKGQGAFDNGYSSWRYQFHGLLQATDFTVLKGFLESVHGNRRDCTIKFLLPQNRLNAVLAIPSNDSKASSAQLDQQEKSRKQLEDMAKDLAEKQKDLQAAQDSLRKQQTDAERDFAKKQDQLRASAAGNSSVEIHLLEQQNALKEQQDKLALAGQNLEDQRKALDNQHQALVQEQTKTSKDVNFVQKFLAGIVLPTTEDPKGWMMRVASVPVQQQQFCRIVDQFYDTIGRVYETHNEIKKNSLFRERQQSMAALLPHGEFSNWVVQVKEVTQGPDGSAAVMLQPPCRVMLGSDACQKIGSKIQTHDPT